MANLAEYSKSDLATALSRARGAIKKAKETTQEVTQRGVVTALSVGSGYAVGLAKNKMGDSDGRVLVPGTNVEADLALGVLLAGAGILGLGGGKSEELAAIGCGALSGYAAIAGFKHGLPGAGR